MNVKADSEMLSLLVQQAQGEGSDLVMIRALVEESSDLGAGRALARLGLADQTAPDDVRELRELLRGWRDAKRTVRNTALGWVVRLCIALLLLGLAVKLDLLRMLKP